MTLKTIHNAISLPESAAGASRSGSQDGPMTDLFGQVHAPASPSAPQDNSVASTTSATSGPSGIASLASAALQSSLESRLKAHLPLPGATRYRMIWKQKATPSGRLLSRLQASALFKSGTAFGGLPTPSGTSNGGKNHVAGRLDEWGGSSNPFRGTEIGRLHLPSFECWMMGLPAAWQQLTPTEMRLSRRARKSSSQP